MRPFALAVALTAALAACSSHRSREVSAADAGRLLVDRNWIDVMPETAQDRLHVFRFVPKMGGGVYQDRTLFKGTFELFTFSAAARELDFRFPETGERVHTSYRIEDVDGPAPFDLRLTLDDSPRGPAVYYGLRDERGADLDTLLATHAAR